MKVLLMKIGAVLIIIAGAAWSGYRKGVRATPTAIVERVEVKGETRIEFRDKIVLHEVVRVVAPDGTITETVRDVEKDTSENKEVITNVIGEKTIPLLAKYSLGLYAGPVILSHKEISDYDYRKDWQVEAARRLVGPVWGSVLVSPFNRSLAVGVHYEF